MKDELEQLLAGFGALESSGVFTLDVRKARVKLARFHLPPGCWVASLVQAGVAAGCRAVQIQTRRQRLLVSFETPSTTAFPLGDLMKGLEEPLSLERGTPAAYLAAGILASGGRPYWSCQGDRLQMEGDDIVCAQEPPTEAAHALLLLTEVTPEVSRERLRYAPIPILVDREGIPRDWERERTDEMGPQWRLGEQFWGTPAPPDLGLPDPPSNKRDVFVQEVVGEGGWDSGIQIPASLAGRQTVHWIRHGVRLETDEVDLGIPGCAVVASAADLTLDLSGFGLVKDARYRDRVETLRARAHQLLGLVVRHRADLVPTRRGRGALETASSAFITVQVLGMAVAVAVPSVGPLAILGALLGGLALAGGSYVIVDGRRDGRERERILQRLDKLSAS